MGELLNSLFNGSQNLDRDISDDPTVKESDEKTLKTIEGMTDQEKWEMLNKKKLS